MKIIAFGTLKGGTGKTTVAHNVGCILAEERRVLFVDFDPQSNLSDIVGIDTTDTTQKTVRDIFERPGETSPEEVISSAPMWQLPTLDIIPSHIKLTETEMTIFGQAGREKIFLKWIKAHHEYLAAHYDYIILDTNPSMGVVNQNAFMSADSIILVSDVSKKAIQGAQLFTYLWGNVCEQMEIEDRTSALILNNCDKRIGLTQSIKEYYEDNEEFGELVLKVTIPSRVDIKKTETQYLPINFTAPNSDVCEAFRNVVSELREREVL